MDISREVLAAILDSYAYEIVFVDRYHNIQYLNRMAKRRYGQRVQVGNCIFDCMSESSAEKIKQFLKRADQGENEMFQVVNTKTGEREFFVPVRDNSGHVIGYWERHEAHWDNSNPSKSTYEYWKNRI